MIELIHGDITKMQVDVIVNAANSTLLGGGGVDGAIHRSAGPGLLEECRKLDGCPTGEARITGAYSLPCKWVIHTVGPVWRGGKYAEHEHLTNCYRNSLLLARKHNAESMAFPCISTGVYGFPKDQACMIALHEVLSFMKTDESAMEVMFVCFDEENYHAYLEIIDTIEGTVQGCPE